MTYGDIATTFVTGVSSGVVGAATGSGGNGLPVEEVTDTVWHPERYATQRANAGNRYLIRLAFILLEAFCLETTIKKSRGSIKFALANLLLQARGHWKLIDHLISQRLPSSRRGRRDDMWC